MSSREDEPVVASGKRSENGPLPLRLLRAWDRGVCDWIVENLNLGSLNALQRKDALQALGVSVAVFACSKIY